MKCCSGSVVLSGSSPPPSAILVDLMYRIHLVCLVPGGGVVGNKVDNEEVWISGSRGVPVGFVRHPQLV